MDHLPSRSRLAAVAIAAGLVGLAACSGSHAAKPAASGTPTTTSATTPRTSATPTGKPKPAPKPKPKPPKRGIPSSPLSGRTGGAIAGPVLVVKVDNSPEARPHSGLYAADVVYIEPVEAGITRIAAVFSSYLPPAVGPVRSGRASDPELFAQYGRVAFAFSGAQSGVRRIIEASPMYTFDEDSGSAGFHRVGTRRAPHNLYLNPKAMLRAAPSAEKANDIGFRFGPTPAGGRPVAWVNARWQRANALFGWSPAQKRWTWTMDGELQRGIGATTVIVQYVTVAPSRFVDVNGSHSPTITTVGSGTGLVLRDGKGWAANWSRPARALGTRWTVGGKDIALAPGQVWVILLDRRTHATLSALPG